MRPIRWESVELDSGIPVMYRDFGHVVRAAWDPAQISFEAAEVLLAEFLPVPAEATASA